MKSGVHEVYHWTSAEYLRKIIQSDQIELGASTHMLNGKKLHGVSLTRNPFLDLANTYAVSGRKPWRIGLDYQKLRQNIRVIPIRDEYLRSKVKGERYKQATYGKYYTMKSHDESEEFALAPINLSRYITSIGFDDSCMDFTIDPKDVQNGHLDDDFERDDMLVLYSLVQELYPDFMQYWKRKYPKFKAPSLYLHNHVPMYVINRDYGTQTTFDEYYAWTLRDVRDEEAA
jgi:hypothetical protein